jgi:hypothetical protein
MRWIKALKKMFHTSYWDKPNTVEFFAFVVKAMIIVPGLLFDIQIWWLYIFALLSSVSLIWSSTEKTLPTLIWFNVLWSFLALMAILKHFKFFSI